MHSDSDAKPAVSVSGMSFLMSIFDGLVRRIVVSSTLHKIRGMLHGVVPAQLEGPLNAAMVALNQNS